MNIITSPESSAAGQTQAWYLVRPSGEIPPARSGAASVVVAGKLYMFGGYGGGTGRLDDFYSFCFESNAWEKVQVVSDEKPGCRENNGVVIGDSRKVYLFGGYNGNAWLNDLWAFDIDTKRWSCIQTSSGSLQSSADDAANSATHRDGDNEVRPSRRFGYVSVVHSNKLVLFGGFDGSQWLNDMYEFDFETKKWREINATGQLPSVRSCPAWAKDDTHVYIQGGYDGVERKSDFFACNLSTYTWTEMPSLGSPPSPRYFHSCCLYENKMYTYGGYNGSQRLADMYAYDFDTHTWSQIDCSNGFCPSGRSSLVAQVHENMLFVFGGYNGDTVLNDFYKFRLNPVCIPPSALLNDLSKLIDNPMFSDVTFLVEGKEIHVNRAIISIRSDFFNVMLKDGGMKESKQAEQDIPIEIKDVSYPIFIKIIEFLYTDEVKDLSLEDGITLLITSERFMLDRLKAICEDSIRSHVSVENVLNILLACQKHNAISLKDIALEFILTNLKHPVIMEGLMELKTEPELLVEIIRRNSEAMASSGDVSRQPSTPSGPFGRGSEWSGTRR